MIRLRASNIDAYARCPGRYRMECDSDALPDQDSPAAEAGRAIHAALEGKPIRALTANEEFVRERLDEKAGAFLADVPENAERLCEAEFSFSYSFDGGATAAITGHPDLVIITPQTDGAVGGVAFLLDYKTGRGDHHLSTAESLQLACYALMIVLRFKEVDAVLTAVIDPDNAVVPVKYDKAGLRARYREIKAVAQSVMAEDAPLLPGAYQCKYCAAKPICPALRRFVPEEIQVGEHWRRLPAEDRLAYYDRIRLAREYLDALEQRFRLDLIEDAAAYSGALTLDAGGSIRRVTDPGGLMEEWLSRGGEPSDLSRCCSVRIGMLKEIVAVRTGKRGRELDEFFNGLLEPFVERVAKQDRLRRSSVSLPG